MKARGKYEGILIRKATKDEAGKWFERYRGAISRMKGVGSNVQNRKPETGNRVPADTSFPVAPKLATGNHLSNGDSEK